MSRCCLSARVSEEVWAYPHCPKFCHVLPSCFPCGNLRRRAVCKKLQFSSSAVSPSQFPAFPDSFQKMLSSVSPVQEGAALISSAKCTELAACTRTAKLEPILCLPTERSSNGSCEAGSALQLRRRARAVSERQRSKEGWPPTRGKHCISEVRHAYRNGTFVAHRKGCFSLGLCECFILGQSLPSQAFTVCKKCSAGAISRFELTLLQSSHVHARDNWCSSLRQSLHLLLCHCSLTEAHVPRSLLMF